MQITFYSTQTCTVKEEYLCATCWCYGSRYVLASKKKKRKRKRKSTLNIQVHDYMLKLEQCFWLCICFPSRSLVKVYLSLHVSWVQWFLFDSLKSLFRTRREILLSVTQNWSCYKRWRSTCHVNWHHIPILSHQQIIQFLSFSILRQLDFRSVCSITVLCLFALER